jgi:hypothetical protein
MPLKLDKPKTSNLLALNVSSLQRDEELPINTTNYHSLLVVIANMFDDISHGADMFMMIGATSKRDSYSLTIKLDGAPTSFYGSSLDDLAAKLEQLL